MAQVAGRSPRIVRPAVYAGAMLLAATALAALLTVIELPSTATHGLPSDWAQRGGWLLVQALAGVGVACVLVAAAWWVGERRRTE